MADSFSDLRNVGGSNKPWIAAGVGALAVALILVALAGAWWSAQPDRHERQSPATVTVTAQAQPADKDLGELAPAGTYTGTLTSLDPNARENSWLVVATFGGGSAAITYPDSGCTTLVDASLSNMPVTRDCNTTPGRTGIWAIETTDEGLVELTYLEDDAPVVTGTLSAGLPE